MKKKTVKDVAKQLNISKSTLRYYDQIDLVKPDRESNGYRMYNTQAIKMLQYTLVMKYGEFKMEEIHTILDSLRKESNEECLIKTEILIQQKRKDFQKKIDYYRKMLQLFDQIPDLRQLDSENELAIDHYVEEIFQTLERGGVTK